MGTGTCPPDPGATPGVPHRPWWLYLIECRDGSLYTGITVDVASRFRAHASGKGARYTRAHPPLRLVAAIPCADRSAALRAEIAMKKLPAARKRALALQHPPAVAIDA